MPRDQNLMSELCSMLDGLTGTQSRKGFDRALEHEWQRHRRMHTALSVALVDLDEFKQYNRNHGHIAGDDCLREVAQIIQDEVRGLEGMVARHGGGVFAVILPSCVDRAGISRVAAMMSERLLQRCLPHPTARLSPSVTLSVGGATVVPDRDTPSSVLIDRAEQALRQAKEAGRNRSIHLYGPTAK
jgi:diguanylate cyclase (GGDEF)-like protein